METRADIQVTLNQLYAGNRVRCAFSNSVERENFRKSLYRFKLQQDEAMEKLLGEKRKTLKVFKPLPVHDHFPFQIEFWLDNPPKMLDFIVMKHEDFVAKKDEEGNAT